MRCTGGPQARIVVQKFGVLVAQESTAEESNMEREEEITTEKDVPLVAKERLEEVDFRSNP